MAETEHADVEQPLGMTDKALRVLGVAVVLGMLVFWAWILSGAPKKLNPDYLDDRDWVAYADGRCEEMRVGIAGLPNAIEAETPQERAETLARANEIIADMLDDLEASRPREGDDVERLDGWFRDWRIYEADRVRFLERLRTGEPARFDVTEHPDFNEQVDEVIRVFADVNDMRACRVPGDVG